MNTANIIAMCAAIFSAISALATCAACILSFLQNRPSLKFKLKENECIFFSELEKHFAIISFEIENRSAVAGMVSDIYISFSENKYHGEVASSMYEIAPLKVLISDVLQTYQKDFAKSRYKLPIIVNGFSIISGFIVVPNFPVIDENSITLPVGFHFVNHNFDDIISFNFLKRNGIPENHQNNADQTTKTS